MATKKSSPQGKSTGGMDWGNSVRPPVDDLGRSAPKNESDVSAVIVICIAIMALTFVIAIPLIGIILMDANNATSAAVQEIKKMRELRAQMLLMMRGE